MKFDYSGNRPVAPEDVGPGHYVQAKYDQAVGYVGRTIRDRSLSFFSTGFGKGMLAVAIGAVAVFAVAAAVAASAGALPVVGAMGATIGTATVGEGIVIGIGQALSFLFSGGGLLAMAVGGIAGGVMECNRQPANLDLETARELGRQYQQNREMAGVAPQQAQGQNVAQNNQQNTVHESGPHCTKGRNSFCTMVTDRREQVVNEPRQYT